MKKYMFMLLIVGILNPDDCLSQKEIGSIDEKSKFKTENDETVRKCGAYEHYVTTNLNQEVRERRMIIERSIRAFLMNTANRQVTGICRIPVVFHIVMDDPDDVTDAQIQTQLDVLNQDFRALNADLVNIPGVFQPLAADVQFEFAIANVGPDCNGITRTVSSVNCFEFDLDDIKRSEDGGRDPIDPENILNIWVGPICNDGNPILGYAQFPGGAAATDGVAIAPDAFGTIGTAAAPFDLGRTATHEIGHYFNLFHIWGDDGTACTGDDLVGDTPNQGGPNFNCPAFPNISCANGPNGDLFMNYMDYVDDDCMIMFSNGQSDRMMAALMTARPNLLNYFTVPELSTNTITISCPMENIDLNQFHIGTIPECAGLVWSTDGDPSDGISSLIGSTVNELGVYFAYFYFGATGSYSEPSEGLSISTTSSQDIHVTSTMSFSNNMEVIGDLYVENAAVLTITSTLYLGPGSEIFVEDDSKLILDGGTLTACGTKWQGIKVAGQFDLGALSPVGSSSLTRGYVELKNGAVIEKAIVGIDGRDLFVGGGGDIQPGIQFYHGGGKITISSGSTIQDCGIGLRLHRYGWGTVTNTGPGGPGYPIGYEDEQSAVSQSWFKGCNVAIFTEYNIGLSLTGNNFLENGTDYEGYLSAVTASGNAFTAFAFIASEYPLIVGSSFLNNTFSNSAFGIDAQGNMTRHNFRGNTASSNSVLGLYGELWYRVDDNEFTNGTFGCFIESTGDNIRNAIMNNEYNSNGLANSVFGENDMEFIANCFSGTGDADIEINDGASVFESQGTEQSSAGNCFEPGARIMTGSDIGFFTYWTKDGYDPACNAVNNCKYPGVCDGFEIAESDFEVQVDCETPIVNDPPSEISCECGPGASGCTSAITSVRETINELEEEAGEEKALQIAQYSRCLDNLMRTYVDTSLALGNIESTINYLQNQPEFRYRIMAYGIMVHNLEYDRARSYIDTLSTSKAEEQDFIAAQRIYLDYIIDSDKYVLAPSDSMILRSAGEAFNPLAGYARTIFYKLTGERITRSFTHLDNSVTQRSSSNSGKEKSLHNDKMSLHIYPNPVMDGPLDIVVENATSDQEYTIHIFDALGRMITSITSIRPTEKVSIGESSGVFIITLTVQGNLSDTRRVVKL